MAQWLSRILPPRLPRQTERAKRIQDILDLSRVAAEELFGEALWGDGGVGGGEGVLDGFGVLGAFFGPGRFGGLGCFGLLGGFGVLVFGERELALLLLGSLRGLELGAEPADEAAGFFGGPLGIQGDQPLQDFLVAERARPAVGGKDGLVEVVVDLPEDADEPLLVNQLLLVRKFLAGAKCHGRKQGRN